MRPIDADMLLKNLRRKEPFNDASRVTIEECIEEVRQAPTLKNRLVDIYCKDCRYYTFKPHPNSVNCFVQHCTRSASISTKPNDYCSMAERKDNGE